MKPHLDFFSFFNLFGALNGFFFAAIFFGVKRGNSKSNRFAALLLVNMAVIDIGSFCSYSGYLWIYPRLQKIFSPFLFLMGPLLFFYVRSLLRGDSGFGKTAIVHFFPAFLNAMVNIASGASWVSFHHGGGVGMGYSLHAGQVTVADGSPEAAAAIERVLTADPGMGVIRHVDAGYDEALACARAKGVDIPGSTR